MKRITYVGFAGMMMAGILLALAGAHAQSLGDYARTVRKDKDKDKDQKPAAVKKYDNDNLPKNDQLSVVGPAPEEPAKTDAAAPAAATPNAEKKADNGPESPADRQKRFDDWKSKLADQKSQVDLLSRELVRSGELARLVAEDSVTGLTSNPAIFQKAIASGADYDAQIRRCLEETDDAREIFVRLAVDDVRAACDVLGPVWDRTEGADGYVSLEVDPGLAFDSEATLEQAVELHGQVERPNLYIKIPATKEGLPAIEECIARGIPINVTLIFSLARYAEVVDAYQRGVERLLADGGDVSKVTSVASFFVSRLDTEADRRLEEAGRSDLQGKLGVANARLAYDHFVQAFAASGWQHLAAAGATRQRPLWASTSTKNPSYRDVMYVEELIGSDTVNTMPLETLVAFRDHGEVRGVTVREGVEEARQLIDELAAAGVDYDDVVATLETEGVQKFSDAFDELIAGIEARRGELAAT